MNPVKHGQETPFYERLRQDYDPPSMWGLDQVPIEAKQAFSQGLFQYIEDDAHGFWLPPEDLDGHSDPGVFAYSVACRFSELSKLGDLGISSPIEWRLAGALLWVRCDWAGYPKVDPYGGPDQAPRGQLHSDELAFFISPQAPIAGFRVDFLMWFILGKSVAGVAVECDGHAFHEKTKQQASRDKARDRAILAAGYPTVRFSGSDIHSSAKSCADEVQSILCGTLDRMRKEVG